MILISDILFRFRVTEDPSRLWKSMDVLICICAPGTFLVSSLFSLLLSLADLCFSSVFVLANKWFQGK
jgi:hypothetical protein